MSADLTVDDPADSLVAPGQFATITVTLTFVADSSYAYIVNAAVNLTTLNIVSFEGVVGGSDMPCGDPVFENATLDSFDDDKTNQQATLNLGVVGAAGKFNKIVKSIIILGLCFIVVASCNK